MSKPVLALETSTPICSVVLHDGSQLRQRSAAGPGVHSVKVFEFVQELLDETGIGIEELSALLVSTGPGSYTGLRIASSAAKGLLFGTSVPLIAVQTLAGIAAGQVGAAKSGYRRIHAVINARRTHLYYQLFEISENGQLHTDQRAALLPLSDIRKRLHPGDVLAGTGHQRLELESVPELAGKISIIPPEEALSAANLIALHRQQNPDFTRKADVEHFEPLYQPG